MLACLLFVAFHQDPEVLKPKEISLPFVQAEVLNSASNLFKKECIENWVKNLGQTPVYLVKDSKEELVGKAVCAYWDGTWAVAKIELTKKIPNNYVCRPHSKPIKVEINEGCYFHVYKADLIRLLIVDPIYASKYPESKLNILNFP